VYIDPRLEGGNFVKTWKGRTKNFVARTRVIQTFPRTVARLGGGVALCHTEQKCVKAMMVI